MKKYLNRQIKLREENLKYDFLPSMIEIIEHPANRLGAIIMFLIIAMIISAVIWAASFKIDIAVTASGSAAPKGGIITLNSISGGRISQVCVRDGENVKKGDVILKLDAKEAERNLLECQYNLEVLEVQREVYEIIYDGLTSKGAEKNILKEIDTKAYGEYASIADAIVLENEIVFNKLSALKDEEEKKNTKKTQQLELLQNLNTLDVKIKSAALNLENAENTQSHYIITAPADGQVTQMTAVYEGLLVNAGDTAGYLLPEEKENIFMAYVADEDIGQIIEGDQVSIKLAAYKDTDYEYMKGNIESIGKVALNIDNIGSAYMVEISIAGLPEDVKAGMEGSCDIIIGQRSVLDYFLEPFKDGLDDSLKER